MNVDNTLKTKIQNPQQPELFLKSFGRRCRELCEQLKKKLTVHWFVLSATALLKTTDQHHQPLYYRT